MEYKNQNDEGSKLYSIMGNLDNYYSEDDDGLEYITFMWVWPDLESTTNAAFKNYNVWKQTRNPYVGSSPLTVVATETT